MSKIIQIISADGWWAQFENVCFYYKICGISLRDNGEVDFLVSFEDGVIEFVRCKEQDVTKVFYSEIDPNINRQYLNGPCL